MPTGRLEKEMKVYSNIEEKILPLCPKYMYEYYWYMRGQNMSYKTIIEYIRLNKNFIDSFGLLDDEDGYKKITKTNINHYMTEIDLVTVNGKTKKLSYSTKALSWYAIKSLYDFLMEYEYIEMSPVPNKMKLGQKPSGKTVYMTEEEIAKVIAEIKRVHHKVTYERDILYFILGVTTGVRSAVFQQMNVEDVNLRKKEIRVIEKQNKTYTVNISDYVVELFKDWFRKRKQILKKIGIETNAVFIVPTTGNRFDSWMSNYIIQKYTRPVLDKNITPHVMRHTCATLLYENTGDIYITAQQLHHARIETTQRYAHISDDKAKEAVAILESLVK